MSVTSGFFNSLSGDRKYDAIQISSMFDGLITDGIYNGFLESFMVTASSPASMVVTVGEGRCWFNHTWTLNDAPLPLTLDVGDVVLNRIDTVVIDVDSTDTVRACTIKVVKGNPSSQAVAPSLENTETHHQYPLCDISVVAGATTVTQSNITNRRGTSDCPFVATLMKSVNVDDLLIQWESQWNDWMTDRADSMDSWTAEQQEAFTTWFQTVQDTLDEDTAGNLYNLITNNTGINATATHAEGVVAITATGNPVNIVFLAPSDWAEADTYTYNGTPVELVDLLGEPVEDAWIEGSPVSLTITGGKAFFKNGGGRYKPTDLPPLNPNFKMEISEGDSEDTVTVTADKLTISPTTDMLAGGQWEYGTEMSPAPGKGQNIKHWTREQLVTSGKPFDGLFLGDVTASDAVNETILWLPENQNGETVLVPFIVLSTDYLGGVYVMRKYLSESIKAAWGSSMYYPTSTLDSYIVNTYLNSILSKDIVDKLVMATVPVVPWASSGQDDTMQRKAWSLSYGELYDRGVDDDPKMPYFEAGASHRIAYVDGGSTKGIWWTRSINRSGGIQSGTPYSVDVSGAMSNDSGGGASNYVRPAFVLPKDFQIQQRPDGSYTVYNNYGLITLKDIKVSNSSSVTKIHVRENSGVYIFDYVSSNYNDSGRGCLFREEALAGTVGTSVTYPSGGAGQGASNWEAALPSSLRNLISEVTIKYKNATSVQETTARAFVPSIDEMYGTETNYGTGTQWGMMKVTANRIRHYNGSPISYWLRDAASSTTVNYMYTSGNYNSDGVNYQKYCVPAFTLPLTAPIRLLADGSYDLVPEDPSLSAQTVSTLAEGKSDTTVTLADIPVSSASAKTIVKIPETDGSEHEYLYLSSDYEGTGRALLRRVVALDETGTIDHNYETAGTLKGIIDNWVDSAFPSWIGTSVIPVSVPYSRKASNGASINIGSFEARAFPLGYKEIGGSTSLNTGTPLPYFSNDSRRIVYGSSGSPVNYWTRDFYGYSLDTNYADYYVNTNGQPAAGNGNYYAVPAITLPLSMFAIANDDGTFSLTEDTGPTVSFSFTVPHGTQPVVRQYTYNYEEHYQTMLEGGVLPALVDEGPTYSEVLSENTWAQIAQAVADKDPILDVWQVGDTKDEVIAGETLTFAIMGKNMDDLADGSGKAGLTFGMTQLMASTRQMNSSNTNAGSFAGSAMYSWLSGTIYPNLPAELKDAIKAVNKKTSSGGGSSVIRTDPMYLWLFAEIEVFGTTTYSYAGEGTQYPYFATAAERIKRLSNGAGAASYWWERSPQSPTYQNTNFCCVTGSGSKGIFNASTSYGVCFVCK